MDRRTFLVTSLSTGFALAVSPAGAQTITTDATGLVAGEVKIGQMPAYRAMPDTKDKKFPLVLVVHEIFGVHEHIKDLCRRLAKQGYLAIAPELFARQGDVSKMSDINEIITKVVGKVADEQVIHDLDACVDWAKQQGKLDGDRVAIAGFCWGGRIVWLYGASPRAPKAGAAWYGRLSHATNAFQTKTPIDLAPKIKTPIIGFYGGKDSGIPLGHIEMMKRELQAAGSKSEIDVYPNAGHGFNADYRPGYDPSAAKDAWGKMLDWFKKNGV